MPHIKTQSTGAKQRSEQASADLPVQLKANLRGKSFQEQQAALKPGAEGARGGGQPLPESVRAKMERGFGADLSDVRIHEGGKTDALGAQAYTQGSEITFAPGRYQPDSSAGQELLGHELTHVIQQRAGRVAPQGRGGEVVGDRGLEREADVMGAKVARGEAVDVRGATQGPSAGQGGAVQCFREIDATDTKAPKNAFVSRELPKDDIAPGDELYKESIKKNIPALRLSDDEKMAVENSGSQAQAMFATAEVIQKSNSKLAANESPVRLNAEGGKITPGNAELQRAVPRKMGKDGLETDSDFHLKKHHCDEFANEVSGSSVGLEFDGPEGDKLDDMKLGYLDKNKDSHRAVGRMMDLGSTTERNKDKIMTPEGAMSTAKKYGTMDPKERSKLSKRVGVNEYADKKIKPGESIGTYSVTSQRDTDSQKIDYTSLPDKDRKKVRKMGNWRLKRHTKNMLSSARKVEQRTGKSVDHVKKKMWTFHYAGAVARSGGDWMSLENYNRFSEANDGLGKVWDKVKLAHGDLLKTVQQVEEAEQKLSGSSGAASQYKALVELLNQAAQALSQSQQEASQSIQETMNSYSLEKLWYFQMYGPAKKGQSYHQQQAGTGTFTNPLTMKRRGKSNEPFQPIQRQKAVERIEKKAEALGGHGELETKAQDIVRRAKEAFNPTIDLKDVDKDPLRKGSALKLEQELTKELDELIKLIVPVDDSSDEKKDDDGNKNDVKVDDKVGDTSPRNLLKKSGTSN